MFQATKQFWGRQEEGTRHIIVLNFFLYGDEQFLIVRLKLVKLFQERRGKLYQVFLDSFKDKFIHPIFACVLPR